MSRIVALLALVTGAALTGCMGAADKQSGGGEAPRAALLDGHTFLRVAETATKASVASSGVRDCLKTAFNADDNVPAIVRSVIAGVSNDDPMGPLTADSYNAITRIAGCFCEETSRYGNRDNTAYAGINFTTAPDPTAVKQFIARIASLGSAAPEAAIDAASGSAVGELMKITGNNRAIWVGACVVGLTAFHSMDR